MTTTDSDLQLLEDVSLSLSEATPTGLPYDRLAEARATCPVVASKVHNLYVVTTYQDVRFVLEHPEIFSSEHPALIGAIPVRLPPLDSDPPLQQEFRKLLNPFFTRKHFAAYEDDMRRIAQDAIATWVGRGRCEFVSEFAIPYTTAVLAQLVFGETDPNRLAEATKVVTAVAEEQTDAAFGALAQLAGRYLAERAQSGTQTDDILGALVSGTLGDRPLTPEEQMGVIAVLFLGGLDTTRSAIGNIAKHVATDPTIEARLRNPAWTKHDLDEFLRFESPVVTMARTVLKEVELGGRTLRPGDRISVVYGSANRDEQRFPNGDELRFDRPPSSNAAFGLGIHRCIGMHLARFQITVAFEELLARITRLRLAEGFSVTMSPGTSLGPLSLEIEFDGV